MIEGRSITIFLYLRDEKPTVMRWIFLDCLRSFWAFQCSEVLKKYFWRAAMLFSTIKAHMAAALTDISSSELMVSRLWLLPTPKTLRLQHAVWRHVTRHRSRTSRIWSWIGLTGCSFTQDFWSRDVQDSGSIEDKWVKAAWAASCPVCMWEAINELPLCCEGFGNPHCLMITLHTVASIIHQSVVIRVGGFPAVGGEHVASQREGSW